MEAHSLLHAEHGLQHLSESPVSVFFFFIFSKEANIFISRQVLNIQNCLPSKETPPQQAQNYLDTVLPQMY